MRARRTTTDGIHACGTPLVTTLDALSRPRERCPKCDRVARPSRLPVTLRGVSQAKHAPPRPTAPARRRIFIDDASIGAGPRCVPPPAPAPKPTAVPRPAPAPAVMKPRPTPATRAAARRGLGVELVKKPRTYALKPCDSCGRDFTPTGGRSVTCPPCKAKAVAHA